MRGLSLYDDMREASLLGNKREDTVPMEGRGTVVGMGDVTGSGSGGPEWDGTVESVIRWKYT